MFASLITKSGEKLYYKAKERELLGGSDREILGRHEIARLAFQKYELREALRTPQSDVQD